MPGKKPVTLWRPDGSAANEPPKGYHYCVVSMCTELVRDPGKKCHLHEVKKEENIHRAPRNTHFF